MDGQLYVEKKVEVLTQDLVLSLGISQPYAKTLGTQVPP